MMSQRRANARASHCISLMREESTAVRWGKYSLVARVTIEMKRQLGAAVLILLAACTGPLAVAQQKESQGTPPLHVTAEDLLRRPVADNWPSYNGDYTGARYSTLREINRDNVGHLRAAWVFHPGNSQRLEVTPVVMRGVMYLTSANDVFALDAGTGRQLWHYVRPISPGLLDDAAAHKSRGVAVWEQYVYSETDDAHLLCLDARSGNLLWDVEYADKVKQYGATSAPLIVKDEVIVGTSGGDSGVRGFLAAYDARRGTLKWKLWTIPAPGEFGSESWPGDLYLHGGATTWMPGTYDPELDTLYWTTSNAAPDFDGSSRPGDDLYTACVLAIDPNTGKLKWYFQFTPHDIYDYDANETPVLVDQQDNGLTRHLLVQANRNGFFYVLDRTNGKFLRAAPFLEKLNWATGIDASGRPVPSARRTGSPLPTTPTPDSFTSWLSKTATSISRSRDRLPRAKRSTVPAPSI